MDKATIELINEYITSIGDGDQSFIEPLYKLTGAELFYVSYIIVNDRNDARDVFDEFWSDIMYIASRFHYQFNGYAYLSKVLTNRALKFIAKRKHEIPTDAIEEYENLEFSCDAALIDEELQIDLRAALKRLTGDQRQIIYLYYWQELNVRQIAAALGMSKSKVGRIKLAAQKVILKYLSKRGWND